MVRGKSRHSVSYACDLYRLRPNSVLCRLTLSERIIDPASFTAVRLVAGAITLWIIAGCLRAGCAKSGGSWISATARRAATVQLAVPVLAAVGGAVVLSEAISLRLLVYA